MPSSAEFTAGLVPDLFPDKLLGEIINTSMDFTLRLQDAAPGTTVTGGSVAIDVYSGSDANASAFLSGSSSFANPRVYQTITGGVIGVVYELTYTAQLSTGENYEEQRLVQVVAHRR